MKVTLILGCILISLSPFAYGQRLSANDPNYQSLSQLSNSIGWYHVRNTNAWDIGDADADRGGARRMETLEKLRAAGVPDTRTIEVQWESPEFKPGVRSLADIRGSCEHVARLGKIKDFEKWAILAMQAGTNYSSGAIYYKQCIQSYNLITKGGVAPSDRVPDRLIGSAQWSGSSEEIRLPGGMGTADLRKGASCALFFSAAMVMPLSQYFCRRRKGCEDYEAGEGAGLVGAHWMPMDTFFLTEGVQWSTQ